MARGRFTGRRTHAVVGVAVPLVREQRSWRWPEPVGFWIARKMPGEESVQVNAADVLVSSPLVGEERQPDEDLLSLSHGQRRVVVFAVLGDEPRANVRIRLA
jgi:hypothetical protein